MSSRNLYYVLEDDRFEIQSNYNDNLSKLLGLRGFEYTINSDYFLSVHSDYFDIDRFMKIIDMLRFDDFFRWGGNSLGWETTSREKFLKDVLATLV